jgi:hypothetical protein
MGEGLSSLRAKTQPDLRKTGSRKTGSRKTGSRKTGSRKTGSRKTGSRKTGSRKTGSRKTGSRKTGCLAQSRPRCLKLNRQRVQPSFSTKTATALAGGLHQVLPKASHVFVHLHD